MKYYVSFALVALSVLLSLPALAGFTVIIDAGSSGSRLHVFQYEPSQTLPVITDIFSENIKLPLSSFANHPEDSPEAIKKLLDDATQLLLKNHVGLKEVSLSILATAGMRLLPEDKQQQIYAALKKYIETHYAFKIKEIKTITGQMEGVYGWLDVNYLLENFQKNLPTVGSIDMGGASTQIAFTTTNKSKSGDVIELNIAGKHYTIFSKSFLGLGQDQARDAMRADYAANQCYPRHYSYQDNSVGNFNFGGCDAIFQTFIVKQRVLENIIPLQDQTFVAYSGVYYTYHFLDADSHPDEHNLEKRIQAVCNQSWEELQKLYPAVEEKYLSSYCANAVYQDELLNHTYKIANGKLFVSDQINQKNIDWTLGAALYDLLLENPNSISLDH